MTILGMGLVWIVIALAASIALPFNFPYQAGEEVIDTAVIIVLLVPIVLSAQMLDERPASAVRTAARRLRAERFMWASVFVAQTALGALLVTALAPVPAGLVLADSLILAAGVILGFSWLGPARGWMPIALVTAAASTPGLVPSTVNVFYMTALLPLTRWTAATSIVLAVACYVGVGAQARSQDEPIW
jgi:hypothetical protein